MLMEGMIIEEILDHYMCQEEIRVTRPSNCHINLFYNFWTIWIFFLAGNILHEVFLEAGQQAGHCLTSDVNGYQQEGVGMFDMTTYKG